MAEIDLQKLRQEYTRNSLDEQEVDSNPFHQFQQWFAEALDSQVTEPNAFTLATVDDEGQPQTRVVLLKGLEDYQVVFYTNHGSDKGRQLRVNPRVSMCFFWAELERQVRINGMAKPLPDEVAEAYFQSRPYGSQLGAHASNQSEIVSDREYLEKKYQEAERTFTEGNVPKPVSWGGYAIDASYFEFWQGRRSRLHDRIAYRKNGITWDIVRLSP
jgi:pyridoxamine 5'-phosphate oxidase